MSCALCVTRLNSRIEVCVERKRRLQLSRTEYQRTDTTLLFDEFFFVGCEKVSSLKLRFQGKPLQKFSNVVLCKNNNKKRYAKSAASSLLSAVLWGKVGYAG